MDSFGEWDNLCSSILSLEDFDFTSIYNNVIPQPDIAANWFCSNLDSLITPNNFPSSYDHHHHVGNYGIIDHHDHMSMSIEDNKIMDSIFSASTTTTSEILLQEISGFSSDDQHKLFVDIDDVQTNATNSASPLFHRKRKVANNVVAGDDGHDNLINPNKKTRASNNVQKNRKGRGLSENSNSQKASSTRRRKTEEEQENGDRPPSSSCDMNSCSSDNSSEDDNGGEEQPPKPKTRATRGSATDPQSLYARKRRERINERLRILQKLVPNGTKVDISTMLEEAVHYVKFLQLQIKLLSSDDLWMYAPIAYNGMDIGLQQKLSSIL